MLRAANQQNEQYRGKPGARTSGVVHSATSSPKPRERSVNSSQKNKQVQAYDPAFARKHLASNAGPNVGHGSRGGGRIPNLSVGQRARSAGAPQPRPQMQNVQPQYYQAAEPAVHHQAGGSRNDRYDDGDSALRRGGFLGHETLLAEEPRPCPASLSRREGFL